MKEEREMETENLIDSVLSALLPSDREPPLGTNVDDTPGVCPPATPTCGPVPGAKKPLPASPE